MVIAIIPARKGSKRLPGKNMALLNGKPLLQYAIESARNPPAWPLIFSRIVVTSDWDDCLDLARSLNVEAIRRPKELCSDDSHDFQFVNHVLGQYPGYNLFAILRPTSPFRTSATVERALYRFRWGLNMEFDSMRAVEPIKQHPKKMWKVIGDQMFSNEPSYHGNIPCWDMGTQTFPKLHVQNACLHIAKADVIKRFGNVSGTKIAPFFTLDYEGMDINDRDDLEFAEWLIQSGKIKQGGH